MFSKIWRIADGELLLSVPKKSQAGSSLSISPDESLLARYETLRRVVTEKMPEGTRIETWNHPSILEREACRFITANLGNEG